MSSGRYAGLQDQDTAPQRTDRPQGFIFRIITDFKLSRKKLNEGVDVGFRSEGERMAATLEKNLAKFKEASRRRWGEM